MKKLKTNKIYSYGGFVFNLIEKILGSNFKVYGLNNILCDDECRQPILFVANHFTRAETLFIPYIINKYSKRRLKSLAHGSLFKGSLGNILNSLGAVSTTDKNRDKIILNDLVSGHDDWVIYPEGAMLKSKEITRKSRFINKTPYRIGPTRTGSAALAIKSQIIRDQIIKAKNNDDKTTLNYYEKELGIKYHDDLLDLQTKIIPVTISYYPLRPGKNRIHDLVSKIFKKLPKNIAEELEIEGNLLLNAEISIRFNDPILVSDYVKKTYFGIDKLPIIKPYTKVSLVIKYYKNSLTHEFMKDIYQNLEINFDHIFALVIGVLSKSKIDIIRLKRIIYHVVMMLKNIDKYNFNNSLDKINLINLFNGENNKFFDSVINLAIKQNILEVKGDIVKIKKDLFLQKSDFHKIRIENSLCVIANELLIVRNVKDVVKRSVNLDDNYLKSKIFEDIANYDVQNYQKDYDKYFDEEFSKDLELSKPFFIGNKNSKKGVLLCHGYKSSPAQFKDMAKFLSDLGYFVYVIRLDGHGTAPKNLNDISWKGWYRSLNIGYAALKNSCDEINIIGFSTGGLLALLKSARIHDDSKINSVISINSALKLHDIRTKLVPGIGLWNDLLDRFNVKKAKLEYIDDYSQNPEINYTRNYLNGVLELSKLMKISNKNLEKIKIPTLIIQANKDNIVNPVSANIIYDKISSRVKFLKFLKFNFHSIVNNENKELVFDEVKEFLLNNNN